MAGRRHFSWKFRVGGTVTTWPVRGSSNRQRGEILNPAYLEPTRGLDSSSLLIVTASASESELQLLHRLPAIILHCAK